MSTVALKLMVPIEVTVDMDAREIVSASVSTPTVRAVHVPLSVGEVRAIEILDEAELVIDLATEAEVLVCHALRIGEEA